MDLTITSFNCNGFKSARGAIHSILTSGVILCLQELMIVKQECPMLNSMYNDLYGHATSPVDASSGLIRGRPYGGAGFLWRKLLDKYIDILDNMPNWLCGMSIKNNGVFY